MNPVPPVQKGVKMLHFGYQAFGGRGAFARKADVALVVLQERRYRVEHRGACLEEPVFVCVCVSERESVCV